MSMAEPRDGLSLLAVCEIKRAYAMQIRHAIFRYLAASCFLAVLGIISVHSAFMPKPCSSSRLNSTWNGTLCRGRRDEGH